MNALLYIPGLPSHSGFPSHDRSLEFMLFCFALFILLSLLGAGFFWGLRWTVQKIAEKRSRWEWDRPPRPEARDQSKRS